jgi:hypothetical protein
LLSGWNIKKARRAEINIAKKWIGWAVRGFRPDGWRAREREEHQKSDIFKLE